LTHPVSNLWLFEISQVCDSNGMVTLKIKSRGVLEKVVWPVERELFDKGVNWQKCIKVELTFY
jgi:hypothetical protein